MRKLTPSQHRHLKTVTEHADNGAPLSVAQLKRELFGERRNTGAAVRRTISGLRDLGYVTQSWADDRMTFVLEPTDTGRAALAEAGVSA